MKRQGSIASLQSPAFCLSLSPGISTSIAHPLNGYFVEFFLSFFFQVELTNMEMQQSYMGNTDKWICPCKLYLYHGIEYFRFPESSLVSILGKHHT